MKEHKLISEYKKDIKGTTTSLRQGKQGLIIPSSDDIIQIEVAKQNLNRSVSFMNNLFFKLEKRGFKIEVVDWKTFVVIDKDKIRIRFREILKRIKDSDTKYEISRSIPSGNVSFKMEKGYSEREWRDTKQKRLEDYTIDIVDAIELSVRGKKERRIENENYREILRLENEKKDQQERVKQKEIMEFKSLINSSERWYKSQILKNYLEVYETKQIENNALTQQKRDWLKWARKKADWYDPFIENYDETFKDLDRDEF